MKIMFLTLCLFLFVNPTYATDNYSSCSSNGKIREIPLKEIIRVKGLRSIIFEPIRSFQSPLGIEVAFFENQGTITVTIQDEYGNYVYECTIDISTEQQLLIDTSYLDKGAYTITFTNAQGNSWWGEVSI